MEQLLIIIMGVLCAAIGMLGLTLIGHILLPFFGVSRAKYRAAKLAVLFFGLPGGIAGFYIGYQIGLTLRH